VTPAYDLERLAVLVHEVRSPVAALSAIAQAFTDKSQSGVRAELARLAITACRGIERVVLDAAMASVHPVDVDVGDLVDQAVATRTLAGGRVGKDIASDLPRISADPTRLLQALDNLVVNALRHAGPYGEVVVSARWSGSRVLLSVSDSGIGVPLADHDRIFEVGVRLGADDAGSGLGLAIARAIVVAHGGELTLASTPGEGACFTIALPAKS
jgi:signal transduction histidine kinase